MTFWKPARDLSSPKSRAIVSRSRWPELVRLRYLMERCGVKFDRDERGDLVYGLEGAHSVRRIIHVG